MKPYRISELTAHLDRINKEVEIKYAAVPTREVHCIVKQRKIDKSEASEYISNGLRYGALFGPIGIAFGLFSGLVSAGLGDS